MLVFEHLDDVRVLYQLVQTCARAEEIYVQHAAGILDHVLRNAYPDGAQSIKDTRTAARSGGELNYAYLGEHEVHWIAPADTPADMSHLQDYSTLADEVDNLAAWCAPKCQQRPSWHRPGGTSMRQSAVESLCHLQLLANRMFNVRLPAFPEEISLRVYEKTTARTYISRKTRDQARDLQEDQLRLLQPHQLRNLWYLLQILQDEYLRLRRHRLRPNEGSLLDLLFQHAPDEKVWSISLWLPVQSMLSKLGLHIVPPRPGTSFRFRGNETIDELHQVDAEEFDQYFKALRENPRETTKQRRQCSICVARGHSPSPCPHAYLDKFRPLLGLPYGDATCIAELVRFKGSLQPIIVTKPHWAYGGGRNADHSRLEMMLWECTERHRPTTAAKHRSRAL